jgi:hypothetical protein
MGDPQQKVGPLKWTEKVNENKITQNGVPPTQRWIAGLDDDGPQIFGFVDLWMFDFLDFFFLDNVLSGTPNTVSIGEGGPRYFGTSL